MLIWNSSKLTTAGKALLAKAQAGKATIKITKLYIRRSSRYKNCFKNSAADLPDFGHADQQRQYARVKNYDLEQNRRCRAEEWI